VIPALQPIHDKIKYLWPNVVLQWSASALTAIWRQEFAEFRKRMFDDEGRKITREDWACIQALNTVGHIQEFARTSYLSVTVNENVFTICVMVPMEQERK
jgi:hypothetical protein